jgi:predicted HicB family RNase H-like nuclease
MDDQLNLRVSSRLRRQLEAAAKRDRRQVTELARIVLQDWLAAHAGDTGSSQP